MADLVMVEGSTKKFWKNIRDNWHAGQCFIFCRFRYVRTASKSSRKESCMNIRLIWALGRETHGRVQKRLGKRKSTDHLRSFERGRAAEEEFNDKQPIDVDACAGCALFITCGVSCHGGLDLAQFKEQAPAT